ncbi:MAG: hypothetical protein AAF627_11955 [Myxococcota bacterium]
MDYRVDKVRVDAIVRTQYGCKKHVQKLPSEALRKWSKLTVTIDESNQEKIQPAQDDESRTRWDRSAHLSRPLEGALAINESRHAVRGVQSLQQRVLSERRLSG